jgi:hypothetical protein
VREHPVEIGGSTHRVVLRHEIEEFVDLDGHPGHDLARHRGPPPGQLADEHLVEQDAERVDVRGGTRFDAATEQLRCHVADGAEADIGLPDLDPVALERARQAEVGQLHVAAAIEQHVLGFEIAMHQPVRVGCTQPQRHLNEVADGHGRRQRAPVQQGPQVAPRRQLHHEVGRIVGDVLVEDLDRERRDESGVIADRGLQAPHDLVALIGGEQLTEPGEQLERHRPIDAEQTPAPHAADGAEPDGLCLQVTMIEPRGRIVHGLHLGENLAETVREVVLKIPLERPEPLRAAFGALPPGGRQLEDLGASVERREAVPLEALDHLTKSDVHAALDPTRDVAGVGPAAVLRLGPDRAQDQNGVFEEQCDGVGGRGHGHSERWIPGVRRYLAAGGGSSPRRTERV